MKVSGVGSASSTERTRRTDKASDKGKGEFRRALAEAIETFGDTPAVEASTSLGGVDSLYSVQAVGDATERESRRRLVRRGVDILDRLEEVRHGLLMGTLPKDKLVILAQLVRNQREVCGDPQLAALLDEIELRAEVELAKLAQSR